MIFSFWFCFLFKFLSSITQSLICAFIFLMQALRVQNFLRRLTFIEQHMFGVFCVIFIQFVNILKVVSWLIHYSLMSCLVFMSLLIQEKFIHCQVQVLLYCDQIGSQSFCICKGQYCVSGCGWSILKKYLSAAEQNAHPWCLGEIFYRQL